MRIHVILCLLLAGMGAASHARAQSPAIDVFHFRTLSAAERYRLVLDFPVHKMGKALPRDLYPPLIALADSLGDLRTACALRLIQNRTYKTDTISSPEQQLAFLSGIETTARAEGFEAEFIMARHSRYFIEYKAGKRSYVEMYAALLSQYADLERLGFNTLEGYPLDLLLLTDGKFFLRLGDTEKAMELFRTAERFIAPERPHTYILVLNHIQTIYQQNGDLDNGIGYARRILDFVERRLPVDSSNRQLFDQWYGLASIDIASMLVQRGDFAEGEHYAANGYARGRTGDFTSNEALQAEYDQLQVLISTKLALNKVDEAGMLLRRVDTINDVLDRRNQPDYLKHLRFYESYARWCELTGDYARAVYFANQARPRRDSLERRNDAHKLERIKQQLEARQYLEKIAGMEREKRRQQWLVATLAGAALLAAIALLRRYRRLKKRHRLARRELAAARAALDRFTRGIREKSEQLEALRTENAALIASDQRAEHLEQLTRATILTDEDWAEFRVTFEKVYPDFFAALKSRYPDLTPAETRLLTLEKLDLGVQEMANMLGVTKNTIHQTRYRLRRKMDA